MIGNEIDCSIEVLSSCKGKTVIGHGFSLEDLSILTLETGNGNLNLRQKGVAGKPLVGKAPFRACG